MKQVVVVEGKNDISKLKTLYKDLIIIKTNGLGFTNEKISEIKEYEKKGYEIVLLLDPDTPGETIRRELKKHLKNPIDIFIPKDKCIKNNSVGIENLLQEDLKELFSNKINLNNNSKNTLTFKDLYDLGLIGNTDSKEKRNKITNYFKIGHANGKRLHEVLNILGVTKDKIKEVLNV